MQINVITNRGVFDCTRLAYRYSDASNPTVVLYLTNKSTVTISSKDIFSVSYVMSNTEFKHNSSYTLDWKKALVRIFWLPEMFKCSVVTNPKDPRRLFLKYTNDNVVTLVSVWKNLTEVYVEYKT